jgi:hypothetical protein
LQENGGINQRMAMASQSGSTKDKKKKKSIAKKLLKYGKIV